MTQPESAPAPTSSPSTAPPALLDSTGATMGFLLLRGWLGMRALLAGIEKFSARVMTQTPLLNADGTPDASGAVVEVQTKVYGLSHYHALPTQLQTKFAEEPLLLNMLTGPFYSALGYLLIILGLTLLLGIFTRATLFGMGLLYIVLTCGLILIGQDAGVAWLGIHIGLVALALAFAQYNRFTVTRL